MTEIDDLKQQLSALHATVTEQAQTIARAMKVLDPSMPESGIEDACRQKMQALISYIGTCETLEAQLTTTEASLRSAQQEVAALTADRDGWIGLYETRQAELHAVKHAHAERRETTDEAMTQYREEIAALEASLRAAQQKVERLAFRAGFLAVCRRRGDDVLTDILTRVWSFDGVAAADLEPEAFAAWQQQRPA